MIDNKIDSVAHKTLGQQMADTAEEHSKQQIEVGELVEEIGNKEVMKEIWRQIDERRGLPQWNDKYWLLVYFRKNPILVRTVLCFVQCRHTAPNMEPGLTCFSFDPIGDKLNLEWVLPDKHAFKTFLSTRHYNDKFLMHCIDRYLEGKLV